MMDVEELERALLEGARKELAPSASDRMRIQSRLVGNTAWFQPAPVRRSVLRALTRSWRGGLALGFAVGALLGFGASQGVGYTWQRFASDPLPALGSAEPERVSLPTPGPVPTALTPALEPSAPSAVLEPAALPERRALAPRGRAGAAALARAAGTEESGSTLARELALLQRARRALNRNDALLALGIVQSLDERFPGGVLMEERAATRILSLCQLDRRAEAREQGQRFLLEHARSVYAERVLRSCAGER